MTVTQKLTIRASEIRSRLNEISGLQGDQITEEVRAESDALGVEYRDAETKLRAAIVAGDDGTPAPAGDSPETRELRSLNGRADCGEIYTAALEKRSTTGATLELQQHYGLGPNQIPLGMLETRAVTPGPTDVGQTAQATIPYVFPASAAAFLGVDMPTVGVGEAVFPVLATAPTVHAPAEDAVAAETTGSFTAAVLSPARLQASFFYSREDRARFGSMDADLRMALSSGLSDGLDAQILAGTNGLFTATNLDAHAAAAVTTFALYLSTVAYARVDGRYAQSTNDLAIVMGDSSYAHCAAQYRNATVDRSALNRLEEVTGGVRVSAHVPAAASNKQNAVIRLGTERHMTAPVWQGITLLADEITKASTGQIVITAVMLHAVKILRADGFYKQELQHA